MSVSITDIDILCLQDNPESSELYLLRGLLNILQNYTWEPQSDAKVVVYTRILAMLSASCQESYPYHVNKGTFLFFCHLHKLADTEGSFLVIVCLSVCMYVSFNVLASFCILNAFVVESHKNMMIFMPQIE